MTFRRICCTIIDLDDIRNYEKLLAAGVVSAFFIVRGSIYILEINAERA